MNEVFVVDILHWDYKIGHCSTDIAGISKTFDDAMKLALKYQNEFDDNDSDEESDIGEIITPKTFVDLVDMVDGSGCVWSFNYGEHAEWCYTDYLKLKVTKCKLPT